MVMQEISRSEWKEFLDQFSRLHHGQPARIESGPAEMPHLQAHDLPLLGVSMEREQIEVFAGEAGGANLGHVIKRPVRLCASEWNDGISAMLEIASEDGSTTRVRVGPAQQTIPEGAVLDGFYERE